MKIKSTTKTIILSLLLNLVLGACAGTGLAPTIAPSAVPEPTPTPTATPTPLPDGYVEYYSQSGDTLKVVAAHFGVKIGDIIADPERSATLLIDPGTRLLVKDVLSETTPPELLFPDSAIVFSPTSATFDIMAFAAGQDGFMSTYTELMTRGETPAAEIIYQLALEFSINPRILLALMEYESGWVTQSRPTDWQVSYPFGWEKSDRSGIYFQTGWAINQLTQGYYGWRAGTLTELTFKDGSTLRLNPNLNAGTVAVMYTLAQIHDRANWEAALYGNYSVLTVHMDFFGDAWQLGNGVDPIFSAGLEQLELNLPFPVNEKWNYTCGPHTAWGEGGAAAALDFAPPLNDSNCGNSTHWTTAAAAGRVVRAGGGVVVLDLDKDGYEQTGWVLVYMHVANSERVQVGQYLSVDDAIGHPSCEGGSSSGIHVHIARKYMGEWVLADGGIPFELSGYRAYNGGDFCEGSLKSDEYTITANYAGNYWTRVIRPESRPEFFYTPTPKK